MHIPAGPAMALGENLKAQAEAGDQRTDNLPSFKDIGSSLNSKFGQTDPKDVGKAIDQNTPGRSSFTKLSEKERFSLQEH